MHVDELQQGTARTPIHSFIQRELGERVEMILSLLTSGRGVDINLTHGSGNGNTPLHLAADVSMPYPKACVLKHTVLRGYTHLAWQVLSRNGVLVCFRSSKELLISLLLIF